MAPDQGLYSTSTNTVGASSIMQVMRGQHSGSYLLATGCHTPTGSLQTGITQSPSPELTWEQRLRVASSGHRSRIRRREPRALVGQPREWAPGRPHSHPQHSTYQAAQLQLLICMSAVSPMLVQHKALAW